MNRTANAMLLKLIDQAYDARSWHGPNLRSSLRGISAQEASFRPGKGRKSIWEHVVHAAYWKYVVRRRLLGEKRGSFPLKGSNWFTRPMKGVNDASQWKADVQLLDDVHQSLRAAIEGMSPVEVTSGRRGTASAFDLICGIAAHDVYHAGQINLLKRMAREGMRGRSA